MERRQSLILEDVVPGTVPEGHVVPDGIFCSSNHKRSSPSRHAGYVGKMLLFTIMVNSRVVPDFLI